MARMFLLACLFILGVSAAANAQVEWGNVHPPPPVYSFPPPPPPIDWGHTLTPSIHVSPPPLHESPGIHLHDPPEQCSLQRVCHHALCAPGYSSCPDNCWTEKVCH
jgi:hypothetical protein